MNCDKQEHLTGFKDLVATLTSEYTDKKGHITAEFSTSGDHLEDKLKIVSEHSINTEDCSGFWTIFPCDTCKDYDSGKPFHVMIIDCRSRKDSAQYLQSLEIKRQNDELKNQIAMHENRLVGHTLVPNDVLEVLVAEAEKNNHQKPIKNIPDEVIYASTLVSHIDSEDLE
ncbi:conserved hypothetical protein [Vibrio chagasii]|nr:conserved hypothetical protein [Vibrio chagasii]